MEQRQRGRGGEPVFLASADAGGLYRARQNLQPEVTFVLAKPLELTLGTSFERMEDETPGVPAESANAWIASLRYHRRLEGAESQNDLDA